MGTERDGFKVYRGCCQDGSPGGGRNQAFGSRGQALDMNQCCVCPSSSDPFYVVSYYIK